MIKSLIAFSSIAWSTAMYAQSPDPEIGPKTQVALNAFVGCIGGKIVDLEDGISDASVIGATVAEMCRQQGVRYFEAFDLEEGARTAQGDRRRMHADIDKIATSYVLKVRSYIRSTAAKARKQ